jgi:ferritin
MAISDAMTGKLNEQVTNEFGASQTYLAMACGFELQGLKILAGYFRRQTEEERSHALKIVDYLLDQGALVELAPLPVPKGDYRSVPAAIDAAVKHEERVTKQINDLMALAIQEKDYATQSFLKWFVDEQVEEISTMTHLAQVAKMAGPNLLQLEAYVARLAETKA